MNATVSPAKDGYAPNSCRGVVTETPSRPRAASLTRYFVSAAYGNAACAVGWMVTARMYARAAECQLLR